MNTTITRTFTTDLSPDECSQRLAAVLKNVDGLLAAFAGQPLLGQVSGTSFQIWPGNWSNRYTQIRWHGEISPGGWGSMIVVSFSPVPTVVMIITVAILLSTFAGLEAGSLLFPLAGISGGLIVTLIYVGQAEADAKLLGRMLRKHLNARLVVDTRPATR